MGKDEIESAVDIVVGGDLFPTPINYDLFAEGKSEEIFSREVCDLFSKADFSICNLEGVFTDEETPRKLKDGPNIRAPKNTVKAIKNLSVDCVSLANNHATDYGIKGLQDTFSTLDSAGIRFFGAGENISSINNYYSVTLKKKRFIFYGVSETLENIPTNEKPGVNLYDEYRVCTEIKDLKSECDFLIVLYHGGLERTHYTTESVRSRFHRMSDCGADIIISQHTHAIGEEEFYKSSYLLYGQGNFCFHFSKNLKAWEQTALLLSIEFKDGSYSVKKHLIRRSGSVITYGGNDGLSDFYDRSRRLAEGDMFGNELKEHADKFFPIYLQAFRGKNFFDKIARKLLPKGKYIKYLRNQYDQKKILKILLLLQSEEFRDLSTQGLMNMLEETEKGKNNGK